MRLTAPGGPFASQWIDVDEAVIDDAAGHVAEQPRGPQLLVLRRRQPIVRQLQREEVAVRLRWQCFQVNQREAKRDEEKCLTSSVEVSDLNVQQQASGSVSTPL